jgi:hypothetical protein
MTYPSKPDPSYDYTAPPSVPGTSLVADLAKHKASIDATIDFLKGPIRSDGQLNNGIVQPQTLAPATAALIGGWNPRGPWVTLANYAVKDMVEQPAGSSGNSYVCNVAHASGVFALDLAAGKWTLVVAVNLTGNTILLGSPTGRLTLTSGSPVMTTNQIGQSTIYYTPYTGNQFPVWNGISAFAMATFAELSNNTTNSTTGSAGPAPVAANKNYDLFVWLNNGVPTLTRGAAWNSDTQRSATNENDLQRINGIPVNLNTIINGPAASLGTWVGTARSDGNSQFNWTLGGVAAGGTAAILGVWNAYNRREVSGFIGDNTDTWTYTTPVWRAANASNAMRVSYVLGLQEDFVEADYLTLVANASFAVVGASIGFDNTSAPSGRRIAITTQTNYQQGPSGDYSDRSLGFHFMQAIEYSAAVGTTAWRGDDGATVSLTVQTGMTFRGWF